MAMRKLKLQVQMTVDGFVAGPEGQLDWMTRNLDEGVIGRIVQITDSSDTILLGRGMTDGFIKYWEAVQPDSPEYIFARKMVDTPKVVFSKTLTRVEGKNVRVEMGDLAGGEPPEGSARQGHRGLRWRDVRERLDRARPDRRAQHLREPGRDRARDADLQGPKGAASDRFAKIPERYRHQHIRASDTLSQRGGSSTNAFKRAAAASHCAAI